MLAIPGYESKSTITVLTKEQVKKNKLKSILENDEELIQEVIKELRYKKIDKIKNINK